MGVALSFPIRVVPAPQQRTVPFVASAQAVWPERAIFRTGSVGIPAPPPPAPAAPSPPLPPSPLATPPDERQPTPPATASETTRPASAAFLMAPASIATTGGSPIPGP